ncbi:MAG: signal peptide peptidase SppA [Ferrimonas sp.]
MELMLMAKKPSFIGRFFKLIFSVINGFRRLVLNLLFFGLLIALWALISQDSTPRILQENTALVFAMDGIVVEELSEIDPFVALSGKNNQQPQEILLSELLHAIRQAASDDKVSALVLKPGNLNAGLAKLADIGLAITDFKESGKPVLFYGGGMDQANYYLASFADEITINPGGGVLIDGFGMTTLYFHEALEKLKVSVHMYRVGKYKSFAEPFTRNDMSEPARIASQAVVDDLWQNYVSTVSHNRPIDERVLNPSFANLAVLLEENNNDPALMAQNTGLVDHLANDIEMRAALFERFGSLAEQKKQLNAISILEYAKLRPYLPSPLIKDRVAVIIASGTILNGDQPSGSIGGDSTSALLRKAREDDQVKAVVLRVDSGGGSAYASEQIRQQILALQASGKPVVASMGSVAASGGYWISADADKIFAEPTTITGSIGIISMVQTFDKAANYLGVYQDGVVTSELKNVTPFAPLNDQVGPLVQRLMDKGYLDFISLVANARNMTLEQANNVAQGRIWSGTAALELGLVDTLGTVAEAIEEAAALAGLDNYQYQIIAPELSPEQLLIRQIMETVQVYLPTPNTGSRLLWQLQTLLQPLESQLQLDDPNHLYYLCVECGQIK